MRPPFACAILLLGLVSACSTSHGPGPGIDAAMAVVPDAGASTDASVPDDAPPAADGGADIDAGAHDGGPSCAPEGGPPPRFRDLYELVIAANGCGSGDCHNGGSAWTSALDLSTAEIAYRSLVNVPGCGELRVAPCRPEDSTLSVVPSLREEPCGGRHTFAGGTVTEEEAAMIDEWIRLGAAW